MTRYKLPSLALAQMKDRIGWKNARTTAMKITNAETGTCRDVSGQLDRFCPTGVVVGLGAGYKTKSWDIHIIAICLVKVIGQKPSITSGDDGCGFEGVSVELVSLVPVSSTAFIPNKLDINDRGS
jgi:hypothetical protein